MAINKIELKKNDDALRLNTVFGKKAIEHLIIAALVVLYFTGNIAAANVIVATGSPTTTLTVNAGGGADYKKIQDAINSAENGYTILVSGGVTYTLTSQSN